MLIHSHVKPHACGDCGKEFRQKSNLKTHEKRGGCKGSLSGGRGSEGNGNIGGVVGVRADGGINRDMRGVSSVGAGSFEGMIGSREGGGGVDRGGVEDISLDNRSTENTEGTASMDTGYDIEPPTDLNNTTGINSNSHLTTSAMDGFSKITSNVTYF